MRVALVHNPSAGYAGYGREELCGKLQRAGHAVNVVDLAETDGGPRPIYDPGDLVVVAGGDGSVRRVAAALLGRGVPIAIIPLGTANNIANTLGTPANPDTLIGQLESMPRRPFDVGRVSGPWGDDLFLEGIGFGPFVRSALLLSETSRTEEFPSGEDELQRDRAVIEQMVWNFAAQTCTIAVDEKTWSGEFLALHILNLPQVGPNLGFSPDADPSDGYLDVVAVSEAQRGDFAAFVRSGRDPQQVPASFEVIRSRHAHVRWEGAEIHVDEEIRQTGVPSELHASVEQGQLTFLSAI